MSGRAIAKLMERMCPDCNGELIAGVFIVKKTGLLIPNALICKPCNWVYEAPERTKP